MKKAHKKCDNCNCEMTKATKLHRGFAYCRKCYSLNFFRTQCSNCLCNFRYHKNDPRPACPQCSRKAASCGRCKKLLANEKAALKIREVYICKACRIYFIETKKCDICENISHHFQRKKDLSGEEYIICQKCNNDEFITCSHCGKYRKFAFWYSAEKPRCHDCPPDNEPWHNCPQCGTPVKGKGKSLCQTCSIFNRATKRVQLNCQLFRHEWLRQLFMDFSKHSLLALKKTNITKTIDRYAQSLKSLDVDGLSREMLNQNALLNIYGVDGLRKLSYFVDFLISTESLEWSEKTFQTFKDQMRINALLDTSLGQTWRALFIRYYEHLASQKKIKLRTMLSYLSTTRQFLMHFNLTDEKSVSEQHILSFIHNHPGSQASLSSFVVFSGERIPSVLTKGRKKRPNSRAQMKECRELLDGLRETNKISAEKAYWLKLVSRMFFITLEDAVSLRRHQIRQKGKDTILFVREEELVLPDELSEYINRWCEGIEPETPIFRGRNYNRSMHPDVVRYHIRRASLHS